MEQESKKQADAKAREAECERVQAELEQQGYHREDATVSIVKANLMVFATSVPVCIVLAVLFGLLNKGRAHFGKMNMLTLMIPLLLSIPVHEGLHGLGWLPSCKKGWKSIRFGVMWSSLTPYCNCKEAMPVKGYYLGLLMPFTVLGLLPSAAGIITGSVPFLAFGLLNILLAGGDLTIALVIRKYIGKSAVILDHPSQCGCLAFLPDKT